MTSVPKPLKFLRPFYDDLGKVREGWAESLKEQRVSGLTAGRSGGWWMEFGWWMVDADDGSVRFAALLSLTLPRSLSSRPSCLSSR
jgi:hypothetical protein